MYFFNKVHIYISCFLTSSLIYNLIPTCGEIDIDKEL